MKKTRFRFIRQTCNISLSAFERLVLNSPISLWEITVTRLGVPTIMFYSLLRDFSKLSIFIHSGYSVEIRYAGEDLFTLKRSRWDEFHTRCGTVIWPNLIGISQISAKRLFSLAQEDLLWDRNISMTQRLYEKLKVL